MTKKPGQLIVLVLTALPIVMWAFTPGIEPRFQNFGSTMTNLGQIAGLLGISMFSVNLILSSRLKIFDRLFFGLNNLYDLHRKIGAISFSLILLHPILLASRYIPISLEIAASFFVPGLNLAITLGIIALVSMMALIVLTFYAKIKYHKWKISHKFMLVAFALAVIHMFLIGSDVSRSLALQLYVYLLALTGLVAGVYQAFLSPIFNANYKYSLKKITRSNGNIVMIEAEPVSKRMEFRAGQFVFVRFFGPDVTSESHPFSIASSSGDGSLRVIIKSLGDFTESLKNLKSETRMEIEGPFGSFVQDRASFNKQIWIAGGIGITPFMGMAADLKKQNSDKEIDLYYCTSNSQEAVMRQELQTVTDSNRKFRLIEWFSQDKGYIKAQDIRDLSGGIENKDIYICGPIPFMDSLIKQFRTLGINRQNIHFEKFALR